MQEHEEIEMQLWDYLDGSCSSTERERIAALITANDIWLQKYHEQAAIHAGLQAIEPDHTSMRFTQNVMETVAHTTIAKRTDKYLNNWIIKGIAAFFLLAIATLSAYLLMSLDWSDSTTGTWKLNFTSWLNGNTIKVVMFVNIILLLVIADKFIRKNKPSPRNTLL